MNSRNKLTVLAILAGFTVGGVLVAFGQAAGGPPAAGGQQQGGGGGFGGGGGGGGGGRGRGSGTPGVGAPALPSGFYGARSRGGSLNDLELTTITRVELSFGAETQAVRDAREGLLVASLSGGNDLSARARALGAAELALANAQANALERLTMDLGAERRQIIASALQNPAGGGRGGGGGGGGGQAGGAAAGARGGAALPAGAARGGN